MRHWITSFQLLNRDPQYGPLRAAAQSVAAPAAPISRIRCAFDARIGSRRGRSAALTAAGRGRTIAAFLQGASARSRKGEARLRILTASQRRAMPTLETLKKQAKLLVRRHR